MQQDKVKVKLSGVSSDYVVPIMGPRTAEQGVDSSLFYDAKAVELVEKIDYDFLTSDMPFVTIALNIIRKGNLAANVGFSCPNGKAIRR